MHLRNVALFCEVVTRSSFSKAAEAHRVSQSAASQAVQTLEDRVGTVLIDRSQRPLSLTPAGQIYYDGCRRMLEAFRQVEERVFEISDRVIGRLRVAAIYSVGLLEMTDSIARFGEAFPDVSLTVDYVHPDEVYRSVQDGEADLGIVSFPRAGEFQVVPWKEQPMTIVVPPQHRFASQSILPLDDLNGETFVGFCRDLKVRRQIDKWLKAAGVSVDVVHEFDNCEHIKRAVEAGSGIAILPVPTLRRELSQASLVAVDPDGVDWQRPLGFIHRRNLQPTVAALRFIEMLEVTTNV
ncbi:MAG: transcriptional regulator [Planctomycetaceae bacterium]|nr:transcriptional regulator [Planctomycetaceae bacterium]